MSDKVASNTAMHTSWLTSFLVRVSAHSPCHTQDSTRSNSQSMSDTEAMLTLMQAKVKADGAALVRKISAAYRFIVTSAKGDSRVWLIDLKSGSGSITEAPDKVSQLQRTYQLV